jgi:hypothetical protein
VTGDIAAGLLKMIVLPGVKHAHLYSCQDIIRPTSTPACSAIHTKHAAQREASLKQQPPLNDRAANDIKPQAPSHLHPAWHKHHVVPLAQQPHHPVASDWADAYPPVQVAHQRDLEALQQQQQQQREKSEKCNQIELPLATHTHGALLQNQRSGILVALLLAVALAQKQYMWRMPCCCELQDTG